MKIAIPKFFVFVIMTIATSSCAAAVESSNTLTTKVEPSLDNEDKRATITKASSSLALSGAPRKLSKSNKGSKTTPIVGYSRVTIQNDTPYQTLPRKTYSRFPQGTIRFVSKSFQRNIINSSLTLLSLLFFFLILMLSFLLQGSRTLRIRRSVRSIIFQKALLPAICGRDQNAVVVWSRTFLPP